MKTHSVLTQIFFTDVVDSRLVMRDPKSGDVFYWISRAVKAGRRHRYFLFRLDARTRRVDVLTNEAPLCFCREIMRMYTRKDKPTQVISHRILSRRG